MDLHKRPSIPDVQENDSMQETVSAFKDNHLKMLINKGMELWAPIWHSGMREAFLIHVGSAGEAIKKKWYFMSNKESSKTYAEQCNKIKQLKSQLLNWMKLLVKPELCKNPTKIPIRLWLKPVQQAQPCMST